MPTSHLLILGGSTHARALADALHRLAPYPDSGLLVTTSLAGRVDNPIVPPGKLRVGGFGGVDGLASWLREHRVDALIDATHPFATRISANAVRAAARAGCPLLVLDRPGWQAVDGDRWHEVDTVEEAADLVHRLGSRALITTGRQSAGQFLAAAARRRTAGEPAAALTIRCVQAPDDTVAAPDRLLLDRGPFTLDGERELLRDNAIDVLATKNSGGPAAAPKLAAARELGVPVVVVRRPADPDGPAPVTDVDQALAWLRERGLLPAEVENPA